MIWISLFLFFSFLLAECMLKKWGFQDLTNFLKCIRILMQVSRIRIFVHNCYLYRFDNPFFLSVFILFFCFVFLGEMGFKPTSSSKIWINSPPLSVSRVCHDSSPLKRQLIEEHEYAIELERRRLLNLQLLPELPMPQSNGCHRIVEQNIPEGGSPKRKRFV